MRLVLVLLLTSSCAATRFVPLPPEAEVHRARTNDGWEIALTRYKPPGTPSGPPVILCHGISANARNMDLDAEHSMARYFAAHGREAWTMSVRGTGDSDGIDPDKGRLPPITFDAFWRFDLPAVIRTVKAVSGAAAVDYVGHSMGGLIAYAYLATGGDGLNAVATLGTPTRLDWGTGLERWLSSLGPKLVSENQMIPSAFGAHAAAPFQQLVDDGPFQRFFYNPQSTRPLAWQRLMAYGTADVAGGVALQLFSLFRCSTTGASCLATASTCAREWRRTPRRCWWWRLGSTASRSRPPSRTAIARSAGPGNGC
jgi:pimeloyl-ACP methyl ester carboxylesterase